MSFIQNDKEKQRSHSRGPTTPLKEIDLSIQVHPQMIRVDYQKKILSASSPIATQSIDRNYSPVSSIQEEFYSYLGISSKSSGDSDAEPSTTTPPSKSPLGGLDDFDLSKRRSLRVRVVNKLKEHQARLLKMAETSSVPLNTGETSPEIVEEKSAPMIRASSRRESQSSSTTGELVNNATHSSTILARRCYFTKPDMRNSPSPLPVPNRSPITTPSLVNTFCFSTPFSAGN